MAEFSAGLQTRQEERYVLVTGGRFNIRRQSLALTGPPISAKIRGPCACSREYGM